MRKQKRNNNAFKNEKRIWPFDEIISKGLPKNTQLSLETIRLVSDIAKIVKEYRNKPFSKHHKAAKAANCYVQAQLSPAHSRRKRRTSPWEEIHFTKGACSLADINKFRNLIAKNINFDNKPYQWSGAINSSILPMCGSRIAIGPSTVKYGRIIPAYSVGKNPHINLMVGIK